jgi:hypothetical protein
MRHQKWKLFAAALGIGLSCVGSAADLYQLQLRVERNGTLVVNTTADVQADETADFQTFDATNQATRATIHMKPQRSSNDVAVQIQYFENQNGDWILVGEPSIVASLGDEASIQFSSTQSDRQELNSYKIALTVKDEGTALLSNSNGCTDQEHPMLVADGTDQEHPMLVADGTDQEYPMLVADGADPKCCSTKE